MSTDRNSVSKNINLVVASKGFPLCVKSHHIIKILFVCLYDNSHYQAMLGPSKCIYTYKQYFDGPLPVSDVTLVLHIMLIDLKK